MVSDLEAVRRGQVVRAAGHPRSTLQVPCRVPAEDDLLGQMLQLQLQTCSSGSTETLSTEEMVGECRTFFAAGYETSASLITWAMFLLASYPRWQEMVREDVVREYPAHRLPIGDALGKLKLVCYARTYSHLLNYIWCI